MVRCNTPKKPLKLWYNFDSNQNYLPNGSASAHALLMKDGTVRLFYGACTEFDVCTGAIEFESADEYIQHMTGWLK